MRKISICLAAAAVTLTAISGSFENVYAAENVCNVSGRNMMVITGGAGKSDCDQILSVLQEICRGNSNASGGNLPGDAAPDKPETDADSDPFVQQVVRLVNEERARAGLPSLTVNAGAANAAQVRAQEIAKSFSHTRPNGSSFSTALTQAGASFQGAGENIAYGQTTPETVMESWMNSSGHRANILNGSYTAIGVGHYRNASGADYWTQLFIQ